NTGTFEGTSPSWTSGKFGSAVLLPGTDEYIDVSGLVNHISKSQGTLIIWCNFTTADLADGDQHSMFEIGYSVDNDDLIGLRKTNTNTIIMRYRKDDVDADSEIGSIGGLTGLHQYVGTWGGEEVKIYLDGILQDTQSINTITGVLDQAYIGTRGTLTPLKFLDGSVALASSHNRALLASEIALLYRRPF
ncbi:MAG: hypothetical protein KAS32_07520, partial [Candidatus Peribacteraceae bacterium]|nr:hypothetical protein [Candidatus Peribacteraceae bacterium]